MFAALLALSGARSFVFQQSHFYFGAFFSLVFFVWRARFSGAGAAGPLTTAAFFCRCFAKKKRRRRRNEPRRNNKPRELAAASDLTPKKTTTTRLQHDAARRRSRRRRRRGPIASPSPSAGTHGRPSWRHTWKPPSTCTMLLIDQPAYFCGCFLFVVWVVCCV